MRLQVERSKTWFRAGIMEPIEEETLTEIKRLSLLHQNAAAKGRASKALKGPTRKTVAGLKRAPAVKTAQKIRAGAVGMTSVNESARKAYIGPQLPLPTTAPFTATITPTTSESSLQMILPSEHSTWLFHLIMMLEEEFPDVELKAVGPEGSDRVWIKCCDCDSLHETKECDQRPGIVEHLNSFDHREKMRKREEELVEDDEDVYEWQRPGFGSWNEGQ